MKNLFNKITNAIKKIKEYFLLICIIGAIVFPIIMVILDSPVWIFPTLISFGFIWIEARKLEKGK